MKKTASLFSVPYLLWLLLFVVAPVLMLLYQSFFDISGNFTLDNYGTFFSSWTYLRMSFNSVLYAAIITLVTLLISYPTAYLLTRLKHKQLLVDVGHFANLGQSPSESLCFYGDFLANKVVSMPFLVSLGLHPCKYSLRTSPLFSWLATLKFPS